MKKEKMKVIQIIEYATGNVTHEVDVSGRNERSVDRIESGMNRNLDHARFYTREAEIKNRKLINWQDKKPVQ